MTAEMHRSTNEGLDVVAILRQLWRRRWWVVASTVAVGAAFTAYALLATPVYRATTVLISASQDRQNMGAGIAALAQLGGLASLAGINIGGNDSDTEEALAVLRSRRFIQEFVHDAGLMPSLFPELWDTEMKKWKVSASNQPTVGDGYRVFSKKVMSVEKDKRNDLITVAINWRYPEEAARWANSIVDRLNSEMRARAIEKADASLQHLKRELEQTTEIGMRDAINRLAEAQIRQKMLANVNKEYAFRIVDRAVTPELRKDKIKPKRMLLVVLGCLLGGVMGMSGVLLVERRDV